MSAPKPKHPMEVIEEHENKVFTEKYEVHDYIELLEESVRYYFSPDYSTLHNLALDAARSWKAYVIEARNYFPTCENAFMDGYKAALERLKWKT